MLERDLPTVKPIIARGKKHERFFWGEQEIVIPVFSSINATPAPYRADCNMLINVQSARRVLETTSLALEALPGLRVVNIFAEQTPEVHTVELERRARDKQVMIVGPSSVGILIPGVVKLGAIGGTQYPQLIAGGILNSSDTAVVSTSGGMVNELIHTVTKTGLGVSFAMALGGDQFPVTTPAQAFLLAQADDATERIVYFGELGGNDEYDIASLMVEGVIDKEVVVYIAGVVADLFDTPPQFGHAKSIARTYDESAKAKKQVLNEAGAIVCETFADLEVILNKKSTRSSRSEHIGPTIGERRRGIIASHLSGDVNGDVQLLGSDLLGTIESQSFASLLLSMLLGQQVASKKAVEFTDYTLKLLVDHGPYVSGAVNTIVAARAGKDLVSSLASGLLTIGDRFGGAINASAGNWLSASNNQMSGRDFVDTFKEHEGIIPGIGHKKYRLDTPDPRVQALEKFTRNRNGDKYHAFAKTVEKVTTSKKSNLILNVDGAIAAIMLDIFESELGYSQSELQELVDIEFFNALFVLSRSVGFAAHYFDQRRHDEGLLRLDDSSISYIV